MLKKKKAWLRLEQGRLLYLVEGGANTRSETRDVKMSLMFLSYPWYVLKED